MNKMLGFIKNHRKQYYIPSSFGVAIKISYSTLLKAGFCFDGMYFDTAKEANKYVVKIEKKDILHNQE